MEEKRGEKEARVVWKKRKGKMEGGGFPVGRPRRSGSTHKTWKHVISPRRGGQSMVCRFFHPPCSSLPSFPFLFLALLLCHCRASIRFTVPPLFRITETNTTTSSRREPPPSKQNRKVILRCLFWGQEGRDKEAT